MCYVRVLGGLQQLLLDARARMGGNGMLFKPSDDVYEGRDISGMFEKGYSLALCRKPLYKLLYFC